MGVLIDNGLNSDYQVSSNATGGGHVQRMQLAVSTDGAETPIPADSTNGLAVNVSKLPGSTAGSQAAVTVGATVTLVIAANTTRKTVSIRPSGTIYLGYNNTVTIATGFPVYANETWDDAIYKGAIYAIAAGSVNTRVLEAQ